MKNSDLIRPACLAGIAIGISALLLGLTMAPAVANMGPPAVILTHIQGYGDPCTSLITDCHEIVRNTPAGDWLLFQLFVFEPYRVGWELRDMTAVLRWPDTWFVQDWSACGGGAMEWSGGGDAWELHVAWPECYRMTEEPLLVCNMIIYVGGPGEIEFLEDSQTITWGCPEWWWEDVYAAGAVAGTSCAYTNYQCGDRESCVPRFDQQEVHLTAPVGGSDSETVFFTGEGGGCSYWVNPNAYWLTGTVSGTVQPERYVLRLTGDASQLEEGIHQTWAQVYDHMSARCVLVTFEVEGTSSLPEIQARREVRTWGQIKSGYRE